MGRGVDVDTRRNALQSIYKYAAESTAEEWREKAGQVLLVVMESLGDEHTAHAALQVIGQLLRSQPEGFHDYMETVLTRILDCACHTGSSREVSHAAENTLEQLVHTIDADRCMQVLQPTIMVEDGPKLQVSARVSRRVSARLT